MRRCAPGASRRVAALLRVFVPLRLSCRIDFRALGCLPRPSSSVLRIGLSALFVHISPPLGRPFRAPFVFSAISPAFALFEGMVARLPIPSAYLSALLVRLPAYPTASGGFASSLVPPAHLVLDFRVFWPFSRVWYGGSFFSVTFSGDSRGRGARTA